MGCCFAIFWVWVLEGFSCSIYKNIRRSALKENELANIFANNPGLQGTHVLGVNLSIFDLDPLLLNLDYVGIMSNIANPLPKLCF